MEKQLGRSVYLSLIRDRSVSLDEITAGTPVFLSLHMEEEFDDDYGKDIRELCDRLNDKGCQIIADISKSTLKKLNMDIDTLIKKLHLWAVRIDYGFTNDEITEIVKNNIVVLNASTMSLEEILEIKKHGNVMAMHNFYPRKETGLDEDRFMKINEMLKAHDIKVLAFILGKIKRGPMYEGLPTLEKQRFQNSYVSYVEMLKKYNVDQVYLSEPGIDMDDFEKIEMFNKDGIITLPVDIDPEYRYLLNKVLTNRVDSPSGLIRVMESREYSRSNGSEINPENNIERFTGFITIDNSLYKRYCGEIQIMKKDHPKDERVNVIGKVKEGYLDTLKLIEGKDRFILIQ